MVFSLQCGGLGCWQYGRAWLSVMCAHVRDNRAPVPQGAISRPSYFTVSLASERFYRRLTAVHLRRRLFRQANASSFLPRFLGLRVFRGRVPIANSSAP